MERSRYSIVNRWPLYPLYRISVAETDTAARVDAGVLDIYEDARSLPRAKTSQPVQ
jgi:hypothetical protein